MYFPTPLACLMGRGVFFQFRWATDWLQSKCRSCPPDTHYVCVRPRRGREQGDSSYKQDRLYSKLSLKPCEGALYFEQSHGAGGWDRPRVKSLRKKIRSSPDGLAQLYAFRMLQPPWMPYSLYRRVSESRANDSSKPREMRFSRGA